MEDGDVSLILENVRISDSGTYETVVFETGPYKTRKPKPVCTVNLTVHQPGEGAGTMNPTDTVAPTAVTSGEVAGSSENAGKKDGGDEYGHVGLTVDYGEAGRVSQSHRDQPQQAAAFRMHQDTSRLTTIEHPPRGKRQGQSQQAAAYLTPRGPEDSQTAASTTLQTGC
ncbi:hypothetical protein Q5P01_013103 [Channa striata]|uniref:Uncharacterized protein n=1 Tax=Channa striata TaxID=64152 RepID=A0AA88SNR2_CHASR|nr:hypothetical protein Q5P01_013103 [Channa striata]